MLERDLIQSSGFSNYSKGGEVAGFEFKLRMPSYRGMAASLIDGVAVTVDQRWEWDFSAPTWVLQGTEYSLEELHKSEGVRWQLEDPAIVRVAHPGGLEPGVHELTIELMLRMSYIPIEHQPTRYKVSKKVTIIK